MFQPRLFLAFAIAVGYYRPLPQGADFVAVECPRCEGTGEGCFKCFGEGFITEPRK